MAVLNPAPTSRPWLAAARPRTWPAALVPTLVAGGSAFADGVFDSWPLLLTVVGALAVQIAANFANDVSDAARGADTEDRVGPKRMVASGSVSSRAMWRACVLALLVAAASAGFLTARVGSVIVWIAIASVLALFGYVGGPWPYGYRGMGEVFVFVFFGLIATVGSRLAYDGRAPRYVWMLAVPIGLLAAAILVANNLRDLETDQRVGKRTLAVLIGDLGARRLYFALLWGAMLLTATLAAIGWTPTLTLIGAAAAGLIPPLTRIASIASAPRLYLPLLAGTARLHLAYGVLVTGGLLLASWPG